MSMNRPMGESGQSAHQESISRLKDRYDWLQSLSDDEWGEVVFLRSNDTMNSRAPCPATSLSCEPGGGARGQVLRVCRPLTHVQGYLLRTEDESLDELCNRRHVLDKTYPLAGPGIAVVQVAVTGGSAVRLATEQGKQFFNRRPRLLDGQYPVDPRSSQDSAGPANGTLYHHGISLQGIHECPLVGRVGQALSGGDEPRAHLDTLGAESKGGREPTRVDDTAAGQHGDLHGVHHPRYQHHSSNIVLAYVPSPLEADGDHGAGTKGLRLLGLLRGRNKHEGASVTTGQLAQKGLRVPTGEGECGNARFERRLQVVFQRAMAYGEVHTERPGSERASLVDGLPQISRCGEGGGRELPEGTCVGHGGAQLGQCEVLKSPLDDGILDAEQLSDPCPHAILQSMPMTCGNIVSDSAGLSRVHLDR
jgi:hypothetical protein